MNNEQKVNAIDDLLSLYGRCCAAEQHRDTSDVSLFIHSLGGRIREGGYPDHVFDFLERLHGFAPGFIAPGFAGIMMDIRKKIKQIAMEPTDE